MADFIKRDFVRGDYIDYDKIKKLFREDDYLLTAWANNCGITKDDDRCIYGWPDKFEYFYDGYQALKNGEKREGLDSDEIQTDGVCGLCGKLHRVLVVTLICIE